MYNHSPYHQFGKFFVKEFVYLSFSLQIYVSLIARNNSDRKMLEILLILLKNFTN